MAYILARVCLDNLCCCISQMQKDDDPYTFKEDSSKYLALCGSVHVKRLVVWLIYAKTLLLCTLLVFAFVLEWKPLVKFALLIALGLAVFSYVLMLAGLQRLKFHLLIPFFFTTFIFTMILVVHFFIVFLDSANTRDTTTSKQLLSFGAQLLAIAFEVYSLLIVWRLFNYICDRVMRDQLASKGILMAEEGEVNGGMEGMEDKLDPSNSGSNHRNGSTDGGSSGKYKLSIATSTSNSKSRGS